MKESYQYFQKYLDLLKDKELYPKIYSVDGPSHSPTVKIDGKKYLSFCSNNYLGLAGNEEVKKSIKEGLDKYGVGSGSTRLLSGTLDVQLEFEKELADFFGYDDAITFSSGYLANVGVIRMLVDKFPYFHMFFEKDGVIISDELNHASIIDGVRLAKSEREVYKHGDMLDLEKILKKHKHKRKLVISDGVFSMDGDFAKILEISELTKKYDSLFMVDDSHGIGVLGPHGEGLIGQAGVGRDGVDILMGSFTKAFGSIGGFVVVNKTLSEYLRITARSYIFSDPIPPAFVEGLRTQTKIIKNGHELRSKVLAGADRLRNGLKNSGFVVYGDRSSIVPLIIGNENKTIQFSKKLFEKGILAPSVRRPAVVEGKERIRFSVTSAHSQSEIDSVLSVCTQIGRQMGLIN